MQLFGVSRIQPHFSAARGRIATGQICVLHNAEHQGWWPNLLSGLQNDRDTIGQDYPEMPRLALSNA